MVSGQVAAQRVGEGAGGGVGVAVGVEVGVDVSTVTVTVSCQLPKTQGQSSLTTNQALFVVVSLIVIVFVNV
jgi:hypothetical protein